MTKEALRVLRRRLKRKPPVPTSPDPIKVLASYYNRLVDIMRSSTTYLEILEQMYPKNKGYLCRERKKYTPTSTSAQFTEIPGFEPIPELLEAFIKSPTLTFPQLYKTIVLYYQMQTNDKEKKQQYQNEMISILWSGFGTCSLRETYESQCERL